SADNEYIGSYYSTKYANDPELGPSRPIAEGQGNYVLTYSGEINRWGDYFGIYIDPVNEYDVWTISEYAAATNIWGTYVGHVRMVPFPGAHTFIQPRSIDFGDVEIGTSSSTSSIVLANYGDTELTITDIPASFNDYNLVTNLSFPVSLASYDSLTIEFNYSPTILGHTIIIYPITSNDPEFSGITMTGNCYRIMPAIEKTIYASSGEQNGGNILTIDSNSGSGSNIGASLFANVKGLAVNPLNGIIYGLVANSGISDLVRVNSELGDAYLLFSLDIPSMTDIAFDSSGTLYGVNVNGEIYTIDLSNGSKNFVVDAPGSYSGITFNPQTDELWATSRSLLPPNNDAVFKVDLTTGDTTLIGHTGLNKITNDILFDENLNLYGIIGSSSELNDFISINPSDGTATIIGSTGLKHILGLGYIESSPVGIGSNEIENIPAEFSLMQNFPNPFNPSTKIKFTIPSTTKGEATKVVVKVFDLLGNEVKTIADEYFTTGTYEVNFIPDNGLSSGIYFYQLKAGTFIQTKKMVYIK
ncbi:MAG: T9SS type A sorting domain-containing protein, partial [Ignavibacteriaceae bacterium]